MKRKEFIKTLGCSLLAAPFALQLLQSCDSLYYAKSETKDGQIILDKSSFLKSETSKKSYRNFVLLHNAVAGFPICVYRFSEDEYVASLLRCTHQGCELDVQAATYVCPCHGSEFSTRGKLLEGPAEKDLQNFPIHIENEKLYISIS